MNMCYGDVEIGMTGCRHTYTLMNMSDIEARQYDIHDELCFEISVLRASQVVVEHARTKYDNNHSGYHDLPAHLMEWPLRHHHYPYISVLCGTFGGDLREGMARSGS